MKNQGGHHWYKLAGGSGWLRHFELTLEVHRLRPSLYASFASSKPRPSPPRPPSATSTITYTHSDPDDNFACVLLTHSVASYSFTVLWKYLSR